MIYNIRQKIIGCQHRLLLIEKNISNSKYDIKFNYFFNQFGINQVLFFTKYDALGIICAVFT